jgi:hypothetical protein
LISLITTSSAVVSRRSTSLITRLAGAIGTALILSSLGVTPAAAAAPQTSYSFVSTPGDYIGQGVSSNYAPPTATITIGGTASSLTVSVRTSTESWNITLAAPSGERLRPASYLNAERSAFRTGRAPGLDVNGDGRGCNQVYGTFVINQIGADASGNVNMLDATFIQNCESATAAPLNGTVNYNAVPLSYAFASDTGDYIGQGQSKTYRGGTSTFGLSGTDSAVTYTVSGLRDTWTVQMAAPRHQHLRPGTTYTGAMRYGFQTGKAPGLSAITDGRGCNTLNGSFTINALQTDPSGNVTALDATFEQHCEGVVPALHGTIFMSGIASLAAFPVALPTGPASSTTQTLYSFVSAPGDYIGQGMTASYAGGSISGTASSLTFSSNGWTVDLAAPAGERLHPGTYASAERAAFRTGRAPGLDVFGQGRGCNQVWGSFAINQIGADAAGSVTMLDATFTQNCESATAPALQGTVKYVASPLAYSFVSDQGDYIGQGQTKSYAGATTLFGMSGTRSVLHYSVNGLRDNWTIDLAAPAGTTLTAGTTYAGAQRYPFNGSAAGLNVSGDGRGCNTLTGSFTINAIQTDQTGTVTLLNATFEQHCEGVVAALRGTINYNG